MGVMGVCRWKVFVAAAATHFNRAAAAVLCYLGGFLLSEARTFISVDGGGGGWIIGMVVIVFVVAQGISGGGQGCCCSSSRSVLMLINSSSASITNPLAMAWSTPLTRGSEPCEFMD